MQNQGTKRRIVRIRQGIDQRMHGVSAHGLVIDTCSIDILAVEFASKQWVRKLAEELFQQSSHTVHVVLERFWVTEIHLGSICTALVKIANRSSP